MRALASSPWAGLLWPRPVRTAGRRRNVLALVRVRAGRVRLAWAVPLFVVEDLLDGAALYLVCSGPLGRRLAATVLPAWRQLRWSGPTRLLDIQVAGFILALRLI